MLEVNPERTTLEARKPTANGEIGAYLTAFTLASENYGYAPRAGLPIQIRRRAPARDSEL
jgi:hypothetical protein